MVKMVTTQEIKETTIVYLNDYKERNYLEKRLMRLKQYRRKEGMFDSNADYSIGSIQLDGKMVPIVSIFCYGSAKTYNELIGKIGAMIINGIGTTLSAETKIEYVR